MCFQLLVDFGLLEKFCSDLENNQQSSAFQYFFHDGIKFLLETDKIALVGWRVF